MTWKISRKLLPVLLLIAAAPGAATAAPAYTPTMEDMMSINGALHRYVRGLDLHDAKMLASAFAPDATFTMYNKGKPGPATQGRAAIEAFWSRPVPKGREVPSTMFHLISNNAWEFQSPTEVKHFAYWLNVIPGEGQTTTFGASGHYEDIMVKVNGEWYLKDRKIFVGTK